MYSQKKDSKYIPILYRLAKEFGFAMTDLVNQIIGNALEGRSELCGNGSVSEIQEQAVLDDQARRSIVEYCRTISQNLQDIANDFEAKRHLLTLIIEKIEIFKDCIKMHTINPLDDNILSMPSEYRVSLREGL